MFLSWLKNKQGAEITICHRNKLLFKALKFPIVHLIMLMPGETVISGMPHASF